jgi:tRNA dimethylallyltransferase
MSTIPLPLLLVVLGPTGSGKSSLAVALARHVHGEILSCDSVAVYQGMEIGAAKPSPAERAAVPHHLLDLLPPTATMTAGDWARRARETTAAIAARGAVPIVAGGTGLYLRALLQGLDPLPPRCPALRARLQQGAHTHGPLYLHRLLRRVDRPAALRIHPNDTPKLIRAIEIAMLSGAQPPSGARSGARSGAAEPLQGFRIVRIGLNPPRAELYARLDTRAAAMFADGLLEETAALRARYGCDAPALQALGYREAAAVLEGTLSAEAAIHAVRQGHRNYAKRQMTWFRREPEVHWLEMFGDTPKAREAAFDLVSAALR